MKDTNASLKTISLFDFKVIPLYDTIKHAKISDEEYFSSKYKQCISNSKLKLIDVEEGGSPEKYKTGLKSSFNPSFQIGTAVHELVLESEEFILHPKCEKASAKQGYCIDFIKKYRKQGLSIRNSIDKARIDADYYAKIPLDKIIEKINTPENKRYYLNTRKLEDNVILLCDSDWDIVNECVLSIKSNRQIQKKLHPTDEFGIELPSFNEDTFFMDFKVTYKDKEVILPFKMKADNWTIDIENKKVTLNDLKTTRHWCSKFMSTSFQEYHYYRQFYVYGLILCGYCRKEYGYDKSWTFDCNVCVVETDSDHRSTCFNIPRSELIKGMNEFNRLLSEVAYYEMFGYEEQVEFI